MATLAKTPKCKLIEFINERDARLHQQDLELAQLRADVARLKSQLAGHLERPISLETTSFAQRSKLVREAAVKLASQLGRTVTQAEVIRFMQRGA